MNQENLGVVSGYQSVRVKPFSKLKNKAEKVYLAINNNEMGMSENQLALIKKSSSLMSTSVESISELQIQITDAHDSSVDLVDTISSINAQMAEIQGIANQTNLLALNAAI